MSTEVELAKAMREVADRHTFETGHQVWVHTRAMDLAIRCFDCPEEST